MLVDCIRALNVMGFSLDLLGHPVTAHLGIPRSIPAHSQNLSSLFSCTCSDFSLLAIVAKSSTYAADEILILDVPKVYPLSPCYNHRRRGSKNIKNRYGLRVSPCIVPLCMGIGSVLPKYSPQYIVEACEYMLPTRLMTSVGYTRSFIVAKSLAWSMEPKAFLKSMYRIYMSWFVNLASSNAAMRSWSCLDVPLSALNPS